MRKFLAIVMKHEPGSKELIRAAERLTSLMNQSKKTGSDAECPVCDALKLLSPDGDITCKVCGRDEHE